MKGTAARVAPRPADLTVYDRELTPDASLLTTKVVFTIVDGQIVYGPTVEPPEPQP